MTQLNATLQREAVRAGFWFLAGMEGALERENLRLCDGPPRQVGVDFIGLRSVAGTVEQVLDPRNWLHNSLQPNERGHEAMRRELQAWLDAHPDLSPVPDTGPAQFEPDAAEVAADDPVDPPCLITETGEEGCNALARDWAVEQTIGLLWPAGLIPLAGLLGAWLFWLGVLGWWRAGGPGGSVDAGGCSGGSCDAVGSSAAGDRQAR